MIQRLVVGCVLLLAATAPVLWPGSVVYLSWIASAEEADKPIEAPGFVSVELCLHSEVARDIFAGHALINPHAINGVSNPPVSPDGCVKLYVSGRTIFVFGTEKLIADKIAKAIEERVKFGQPD